MMTFDLVYTAEAVHPFGCRFNVDLAHAQLHKLAVPEQINAGVSCDMHSINFKSK